MSDESVPTVEEMLNVLGASAEEISDWASTVADLETRDSEERWSSAQETLTATSSIGPIFGVTNRDLRKAAARLSRKGGSTAARRAKRIFDVVFALFVLVSTLPVLIAAAAAIKASSKGPVFYRSERVGLNGQRFGMIKFRTMVHHPSGSWENFYPREGFDGVLFKLRYDPRVTPVGRFLRRYSLDELPQFFNVLVGDMSVVGPRPPLPQEAMRETPNRHPLVRPGITGLWQVSGRSDLSWEDTVRFDLMYVENWSLMYDIVIIFKTLQFVRGGPFAY
jgi:lipopolysaccharide/colanic/teichoic acid biosynthesis glycosyltransferase